MIILHTPRFNKNDSAQTIVVCIHGFMGTPDFFKPLAAALFAQGFSVATLLLPGHGTTGRDFAHSKLAVWEDHVRCEVTRYAKEYKNVLLVGHSIGGLLALNLSLLIPKVRAVAAISTPLKLYTLHPTGFIRKGRLMRQKDETIRATYRAANSVPLAFPHTLRFFQILNQPAKLVKKTRKNLKDITVPTLFIHSKKDETVMFKSSAMFDRGLANAPHKAVLLNDSYHVYYTPEERELFSNAIFDFFSPYRTRV